MFYLLGSLLFVLALAVALGVMMADFSRYRHAMAAALRSLSLDGWNPPVADEASPAAPSYGLGCPKPALARQRRAAA